MSQKVYCEPKGKVLSHQAGWTVLPDRKLLPLWIAILVNIVLKLIDFIEETIMFLFLAGCFTVTIYVVFFYNGG